ncbi:MAG: hypothetical protein IPM29_04610 [Planctomycetes bacterium]|nr:hypothetical protein [Planctomycetota bacterium]
MKTLFQCLCTVTLAACVDAPAKPAEVPLTPPAPAIARTTECELSTALESVIDFLEEARSAREAWRSRTSPDADALQRAIDEVDAALDAAGMQDDERLGCIEPSLDTVLTAIDAILDSELEVDARFAETEWRLDDERHRLLATMPLPGAVRATQRAACDVRDVVGPQLCIAPDPPEEWLSLFQRAFDLLDADAEVDSELAQQQQQREVWDETMVLFAERRQRLSWEHFVDTIGFGELRELRASAGLVRESLRSAEDVEKLPDVLHEWRSSSLQASRLLLRPDEHGEIVMDRLRGLLVRSRDTRQPPPAALPDSASPTAPR